MVSNDLLTQEVSNSQLINLMMGKVKKSQINKNKYVYAGIGLIAIIGTLALLS